MKNAAKQSIRMLTIAASASALLAAGAQAQNLVANGGFETPALGSNGWAYFPSGTAGLEWTVEWANNGAPGNLEIWRNLVVPDSGAQNAELDAHGRSGTSDARVSIYQNLATCPIAQYELSYAYMPRSGGGYQGMLVEFDGQFVEQHGPDNFPATPWATYTVPVTPSNGQQTELRFTELGDGNQYGSLLDSVSVVETTDNACDFLDVKPQSYPNAMNICGNGVIPIALVGTGAFDGGRYEVLSINLGSGDITTFGKGNRDDCRLEDVVNGIQTSEDPGSPDGYLDLVCHIPAVDLRDGLEPSDTELNVCITLQDVFTEEIIEICDSDSIKLTRTNCL